MVAWLKWSVVVVFVACGLWFYTRPDPIAKLDVHGTWEPRFKPVADVFRSNLKSGLIRGGTFAAYVDGKPVLNLWGGYSDEQYKLEWSENTFSLAFSTTKFVAAIAFNLLVDRGYVKYDDLVSKYWPEFAQNGKANVTVNMLISHQAGLHAPGEVLKLTEVVTNPQKVEEIFAKQKPAWPPGTAVGYHTISIGMLVDILARKIDPKHRPIYQIYEEDIRVPLNLDFFMGVPYQLHYRIARTEQPKFWEPVRYFFQVPTNRRLMTSLLLGNKWFKDLVKGIDAHDFISFPASPELRATPIPAAGGIGNSISLAKLFGLVAAKTPIKGKPLLSEEIVHEMNTASFSGEELLFKVNASVGRGTLLFTNPWGETVFGQPGAGGQMGYSDPKNKVGLAFITNYMGPFSLNDDPRFVALEKIFYNCLGKTK